MTRSGIPTNYDLRKENFLGSRCTISLMWLGVIFESLLSSDNLYDLELISSIKASSAHAISCGVGCYILPISLLACIIFLMRFKGNFSPYRFFMVLLISEYIIII